MEQSLESLVWRVYRRGVIHGGLIAVITAALWLIV